MSERVFDPPQQPTMFLGHRNDLHGAQPYGPLDYSVRILDNQQQPHRASAQRFRAEVPMGWGLVRHPEGTVADRELGNDIVVLVRAAYPIDLDRTKGRFVELDRRAATPHRELGRNTLHSRNVAAAVQTSSARCTAASSRRSAVNKNGVIRLGEHATDVPRRSMPNGSMRSYGLNSTALLNQAGGTDEAL